MTDGSQLGKYRILDRLGAGGFATVYRAEDTLLRRQVALKILHPPLLTDPAFVARFENDARAAAQLDHPSIAAIYELGTADGRMYIAVQLQSGGSLADRLQREGPFALAPAAHVVEQIAAALDQAHASGFVHRDVKPSNILFNARGNAILTDFGLVKAVESSVIVRSTASGMIGTPAYMAPEIWEGKPDGPYTDIYALGCVLFEMLTGAALFAGDTPPRVMLAHFQPRHYPDPWPDGIPAEIQPILERALAREPADRYASAGALAADLQALLRRAAPPAAPMRQTTPLPELVPAAPRQDTPPAAAQAGAPGHPVIPQPEAMRIVTNMPPEAQRPAVLADLLKRELGAQARSSDLAPAAPQPASAPEQAISSQPEAMRIVTNMPPEAQRPAVLADLLKRQLDAQAHPADSALIGGRGQAANRADQSLPLLSAIEPEEERKERSPSNDKISSVDIVIGSLVALFASTLISVVLTLFFRNLGFIGLFIPLIAGPAIAELIRRVVDRVTKRKRGRPMQIAVASAIVLGTLPFALLYTNLSLLVYMILAVMIAVARLR